jgi:integrase/recombinase XerD
MASLHKDDKYWKLYFRYGGKQYSRSLRTTSKITAEKIKVQFENDLAASMFNLEKYSPQLHCGLTEFFDEAEKYSKTNKSASTVKRERRIFNNFLEYFGNVPIPSIKIKNIESYKIHLQETKKYSPNGINIELRHLSAAFSLAVRYGYIMKNPFKGVKKVKVPKKLKKYLNKKQSDELLQLISNTSSYAHVLIALSTGARAIEITKLKWEDIDFSSRVLVLDGKGNKERIVPVPEKLFTYFLENRKNNGYVCEGTRDPSQASKRFRFYANKIGLKQFTFHNLRDTYASWLVQNGINLKIIQELLGHEDIQTTLIYAHLAPANKFEAVNVLDKLLPDQTNSVTVLLPIETKKAQSS